MVTEYILHFQPFNNQYCDKFLLTATDITSTDLFIMPSTSKEFRLEPMNDSYVSKANPDERQRELWCRRP